jgi:hypothetical protein
MAELGSTAAVKDKAALLEYRIIDETEYNYL